MIRFQRGSNSKKIPGFLFSVLLFAVILIIFLLATGTFSNGSVERQKSILSNSLSRIISFCYANEGAYPESLSYIKENYGLTYDESVFYVDYTIQGSNIYPEVTIIEK
jgi:hypothetical protein